MVVDSYQLVDLVLCTLQAESRMILWVQKLR